MAKTQDYMDYLDETIGIAPANSQEELQASTVIRDVMDDHGLDVSVEEFDGRSAGTAVRNVATIAMFVAVLIAGLASGILHIVMLLVALVCAGMLVFMRFVRNVFEDMGPARRSQNVVAVRRAPAQNVVRGSRPIVIVAHYDTPRESVLRRGGLARYQSVLVRVGAFCPAIVAVTLVFQLLLFLPEALRMFMWVVGLIASVPALFVAVTSIISGFGACTEGANDNKAAVAALLAMVDKIAPAKDRATSDDRRPKHRRARQVEPEVKPVPRRTEVVEEVHGVRHGEDVLRSLGILPPSCEITYEEPRVTIVEEPDEQWDEETGLAGEEVRSESYDEDELADYDESESYDDEFADGDVDEFEDDEYEDDYTEGDIYEEDYEDDLYGDGQEDDFVDDEELEDEDVDEGYESDTPAQRIGRRIPLLGLFGSRGDDGEDIESQDEEYLEDEDFDDAESDEESYDEELDEGFDDEGYEDDELYDEDVLYEEDETYDAESFEDDELYDEDLEAEEEEAPMGSAIGSWFSKRIDKLRDKLAAGEGVGDEWIDEEDLEEEDLEEGEAFVDEESDADVYEDGAEPMSEDEFEDEDADESGYDGSEGDEFQSEDEEAFEDEPEEDVVASRRKRMWRLPSFGKVEDDAKAQPLAADPDAAADLAFDAEMEEDYASDFEYDDEEYEEFESHEEGFAHEPVTVPSASEVLEEYEPEDDGPAMAYEDDGLEDEYLDEDAYDKDGFVDQAFEGPVYEDEDYEAESYDAERYDQDDEDWSEELENGDGLEDGEYLAEGYDEEYDGQEIVEQQSAGKPSIVQRILGVFRGKKNVERSSAEDAYEDEYYDEGALEDDEFYLEDDEDVYGEAFDDEDYEDELTEDEGYENEGVEGAYPDYGEYVEYEDEDAYDDEHLEDEYFDEEALDSEEYYDEEYEGYEDESATAQTPALADPNTLHFDREEDDDIVARDDSGLNTISDSYDLYAQDVERESRRARPAGIDDPTWGTSTYQPPRPSMNIARRAALYDLPDPSGSTVDPLDDDFEYEDDVPATRAEGEASGGRGGFWGDDASRSGRAQSWKGGATMRDDLRDSDDSFANADLQDAILELGDEFLDEHDIWFVATGASEQEHSGMKAFIDAHRRDIRGAFLVNLECVGAGDLAVYAREGLSNNRRADRRLVRMVSDIARDLHIGMDTAMCDWDETDAASAMRARVRAVSIVGLDENGLPAFSHTLDDVPENVNPDQVDDVVRIVTEIIRRA